MYLYLYLPAVVSLLAKQRKHLTQTVLDGKVAIRTFFCVLSLCPTLGCQRRVLRLRGFLCRRTFLYLSLLHSVSVSLSTVYPERQKKV